MPSCRHANPCTAVSDMSTGVRLLTRGRNSNVTEYNNGRHRDAKWSYIWDVVQSTQCLRLVALNKRQWRHLIVHICNNMQLWLLRGAESSYKTNSNAWHHACSAAPPFPSRFSGQQETLEEPTSSGSEFREKPSSHIWAFCQWMRLCLPRNEIHISHLASLMSSLIRSRWADKLRFAPAVCCGQRESTHMVRSVELSCGEKPSRWLNTKYRISLE